VLPTAWAAAVSRDLLTAGLPVTGLKWTVLEVEMESLTVR
jgi:hypothetical protein